MIYERLMKIKAQRYDLLWRKIVVKIKKLLLKNGRSVHILHLGFIGK